MVVGGASLPDEILIDIFKLATDNPARHTKSEIPWTPFETPYAYPRRSDDPCIDALRTKHSLALGSSSFRELLTPFLYEHIWIRHGAGELLKGLEASKGPDGIGYGRFVKRVTISMNNHDTPHDLTTKVNTSILQCCPFIEYINRPQEDTSGDQLLLDHIELPYLTRVDWHNTPFDSSFASAPAPRFIFHSNSLRTLILGADNFPWSENIEPETVIDLPRLHTLGINSSNSFGAEPRRHIMNMPSLRRLVIGRPEAIYNLFSGTLENISRQIKALELGADPRFLRHDFVATLLGYCPNAESLYVPLATTKPIHPNEVPRTVHEFSSTTCLYLKHASANSTTTMPMVSIRSDRSVASGALPRPIRRHSSRRHSDPKVDPKYVRMWSVLHEHFVGLCGASSRFVSLQKIVLCGSGWKETVEDVRFTNILRMVIAKGIQCTCDDYDANTSLQKAYRSIGDVQQNSLI